MHAMIGYVCTYVNSRGGGGRAKVQLDMGKGQNGRRADKEPVACLLVTHIYYLNAALRAHSWDVNGLFWAN